MNTKKYDLEKVYLLIDLLKTFFEENESLISKSYLPINTEFNKEKKLKSIQHDKLESIYSKIVKTYDDIKKEKKANLFFYLLFKNKYVSDKLSNAEKIFFTEGSFNPRTIGKFSDFTKNFLYAFNIKYNKYLRKKDPNYDKTFVQILDMMKKYPDLTIDEIKEML